MALNSVAGQVQFALPLPPRQSTLTPEDVEFINSLIDAKLNGGSVAPVVKPKEKRYHTVQEIRMLIVKHLEELKEELGSGEFDIVLLRHFLARKTTLLEGDTEKTSNGCHYDSRWDSRVANALAAKSWPGQAPIVSAGKRRLYRFAEA